MLGWRFQAETAQAAWRTAHGLRWVHWRGAGVDALVAEDLVKSDVVLTNSRGVVDRAMAEYTLGLIIAFAKRLPETLRLQARHEWHNQLNERLLGREVLVVGVGSIGRAIGRLLRAFGLEVDGVGRRPRDTDPDFRNVYASRELDARLPAYDFVVVIVPSTPETYRMFGAEQFARMKPTARLINLARATIVDEPALIEALNTGEIAAAGLDVFEEEPLGPDSPFWDMENVIVSPDVSGLYNEYEEAITDLFLDNVRRFIAGKPLLNVVDKTLGFVPAN